MVRLVVISSRGSATDKIRGGDGGFIVAASRIEERETMGKIGGGIQREGAAESH
jgi:hypothetical protein